MALFTRLDGAALAEIAARFRVGAVDAVEGIAAGTINSNYRVTAGGAAWFVRVNEGKSEEDVAYEAELVAHLAACGVPTPRARVADDGRTWARTSVGLVTVFPWVAGAHRRARELAPADAAACGAALAAMHRAAEAFPRRRESRYAFAELVRRWRGLPRGGEADVEAAIADTGEELAWLEARAAARAALPRGVIHGDLFVDNVLFDEGRLVALLDFEQASDGTLAYDLAVCVCAWTYGDDFDAGRAAALVDGYARVRPLTPAERDGLWIEARAAAMRFTITRLTDVHFNTATTEVVRRTKDFRRYHARLRRLRALGPDGFARLTRLR